MTSIRERILAHLLDVVKPAVGGKAWRSRTSRIDPSEMPCAVVLPEASRVREKLASGPVDDHMTVAVRVYARGTIADQVADPLLCAIHAAIMTDSRLGGLALDTSEADDSVEWDFERSDENTVAVTMRYVIHYRHNRHDLTT